MSGRSLSPRFLGTPLGSCPLPSLASLSSGRVTPVLSPCVALGTRGRPSPISFHGQARPLSMVCVFPSTPPSRASTSSQLSPRCVFLEQPRAAVFSSFLVVNSCSMLRVLVCNGRNPRPPQRAGDTRALRTCARCRGSGRPGTQTQLQGARHAQHRGCEAQLSRSLVTL